MKILLIEDDRNTSELLSVLLCEHRYAVDAIADGAAGLDLAIQWDYDLILLDLFLPSLNGVEVCRRLREQECQTPILMLTTQASNADIVAGLDAGADDYLAKSCDSSQLLARVRALLRRSGKSSSVPVLTWGKLCLDPAVAQVTYQQQAIALRPKEYTLLELFLRYPHRVFSRSAIIDHLWSMEEAPVEGSVTNLIKDLRYRLKSSGMATDLIETVYGMGYRLKAAPLKNQERELPGAPNREKIALAADVPLAEEWNTNRKDTNRTVREQRGIATIQRITERFQVSLEPRIAHLEAMARSLQTGDFGLELQQVARKEAHKLAGGLGTFGYDKASDVAQAMEDLLEDTLSQEPQLADQFSQLLLQLKQELGST